MVALLASSVDRAVGVRQGLSAALEYAVECLLQPAGRLVLRDTAAARRFRAIAPRYREVCAKLLGGGEASNPLASGYDWGSWAASIRRAFERGVPSDFLSNEILGRTMVYAYRRGIRIAAYRVGVVRE